MNKLIFGNCLKEMDFIENKSVDMIFSDLPYTFTNCSWDVKIPLEDYVLFEDKKSLKSMNRYQYIINKFKTTSYSYHCSMDEFDAYKKPGLWSCYKRVLKNNGVIVLNALQPFSSRLISTNLKMYKYSWIWNKVNKITGALNANKQPMLDYEEILIFYDKEPTFNKQLRDGEYITRHTKGDRNGEVYGFIKTKKDVGRKVRGLNPKRIINIPAHNTDRNKTFHPTQKPIELGEYFIKTYTNEGDLILDNCCGSGSYLIAAKNLNRNFIGIDNGYCEKDKIINNIQLKGKAWIEISELRLNGVL